MNSVLLSTYLAGSLLSTATFGTMDECATAKAQTLKNNTEVTAVCSFKAEKPKMDLVELNNFIRDFLDYMREIEIEHKEELILEPQMCGVLGVEPNPWIENQLDCMPTPHRLIPK